MTNQNPTPPFHIDQQIDLLEYLNALIKYKYTILIFATLAAILIFGLSLLIENKYTAHTLVAININEEPGGVEPDKRNSSYTLGLLENDFILDSTQSRTNETKRMLATLKSHAFVTTFIAEENLLPYIFKDNWDIAAETWKEDFTPDLRWANFNFASIYSFERNEETGLLSIFITTNDPNLSATLANRIVDSFNRFTKAKQVKLIEERQAYLTKRLEEIDNIQLHRSIYRMIESQIGAESLIYARKDYPLEIIQPALPPLFKTSPKRKQYAVLTFIAFVVLGTMIAMGSVLLRKIKAGLNEYQEQTSQHIEQDLQNLKNTTEAGIQSSDEWIDK
jgi:hypothetical protein